MIYSKFGTELTLVSRTEDAGGRTSVQATSDGTADVREYPVADLKADDGMSEINDAVARLPRKVLQNNGGRRRRPR